MSLEGRVALVTGGGRGIGRSIALALAEDGADVAVNYRRDDAAAAAVVAEIEGLGPARLEPTPLRSTIVTRSTDMVAALVGELGAPCILVNNAGIASRGLTVEETDPAELERVMRVHALGPHYLCGRLLPHMRERQRGDIVMISSVATLGMGARGGPYNMGKAAMEALASTLAKEVMPDGIRVNVVAPGLVETEMGRRLVRARSGVEDMRELDAQMPFGRVCQPEDIANAVRFFVSDQASYVTGEKVERLGRWRNVGLDPGASARSASARFTSQPSTSSAMVRSSLGSLRPTSRVVIGLSSQACRRSRMRSTGPTSEISSAKIVGYRGDRLVALAGHEELLDAQRTPPRSPCGP